MIISSYCRSSKCTNLLQVRLLTSAPSSNSTKPKVRRKAVPVPSSRFGRLAAFGGVAADVGLGVFGRSVYGKVVGSKPKRNLTNDDLNKIVRLMCKVRGAALKVGQVITLQEDTVIDPEIKEIFERVRDSADSVPFWQTETVLKEELGTNWRQQFKNFENEPFAAASIGQVHRATLPDGKNVAVKVQYPGVDQSVDSDIRNFTALIKFWNILPQGLYVENLMRVMKRELAWETDYLREAKCSKRYFDF